MRIAVWYNLPSGGAKRALFYHVRGLATRGHHVEVWRPPVEEGKDFWPLAGVAAAEHVLPLGWRESLLHKLIVKDPILSEARYGDDLRYARALDRHCRLAAGEINAGHFDLLFANNSVMQSVAPIGRYVRGPRVLYLQEPHRGMFEAGGPEGLNWIALPPRRFGWLRPRYAAWRVAKSWGVGQLRALARAETDNAASFDRILVNSHFSRESVLRAYGLDARVCYLGVDTDLFRDLGREREELVVGVGEIRRHKNVALVIEAVGRLPEPRPRLLWMGNASSAEYLSRMMALAATLGVPYQARTGVGDDELVETLNRAALMAYAPRLEPFGFAPLEANACGTPVVAVAEGGVRETVEDGTNGLLVEHDPRAMADAVARLLRDKPLARRLGEGGARLVRERWSLAASVERLERHLREAVAAKRGDGPPTPAPAEEAADAR